MFEIGIITGTHGIKGEVKVKSFSDFDRFKKNESFFILNDDKKTLISVESSRLQKNLLIVKFKEYNDINEVINFKGKIIYSDNRGKLKKNEFYHDDLIGMKVYYDDHKFLGIVSDVIEQPKNHLLEIKNKHKKYLIPFIKEFIVSVDENILIRTIEGLIW